MVIALSGYKKVDSPYNWQFPYDHGSHPNYQVEWWYVTGHLSDDTSNPSEDISKGYDIVINGYQVAGGSIRIHDRKLQETIFEVLGFSEKEAKNQFGFLLDAFRFGTPPHGGIAFGFDRICSLFAGEESIKDFIAFPKNTSGRDVMIDSPSIIDNDQLDELGIKLSG